MDGDTAHVTFAVDYQTPGTYTIQAVVTHNACTGQLDTQTGPYGASITVTPGVDVGNGPDRPEGHVDVFHNPNINTAPGDYWANIYGWDMDGWAYKVTLDWGDGTSAWAGAPLDTSGCQANGDWPSGGGTWYSAASLDHSYAAPGTYTVTETVYSEDCSGQEQQVSTITTQFTYPN